MSEPDDETDPEQPPEGFTAGDRFTLEVVFLGAVGLVALVFFSKALGYKLVSSRTPFVIMTPLLALIAAQAVRLVRGEHGQGMRKRIGFAFSGRHLFLNRILTISAWTFALAALITVAGHYVAILSFMVLLMWRAGGERPTLAITVAAVATLAIYLLFEIGFGIELYRGLILRWFAGYRDF